MEESADDLKGLATKIMNGYQGMYGRPLVIWKLNVGRPGWNKLSGEDRRVFLIRALDKGWNSACNEVQEKRYVLPRSPPYEEARIATPGK
jgi:hypothetical protein